MRRQNQGLPSNDESQPDYCTLVVSLGKLNRASFQLAGERLPKQSSYRDEEEV